jgi:anti-sigma regulatory factor (Ser/Thr protein kinase)
MEGCVVIVHVQDQSEVAQARRTALELAQSLRFSETIAGKVALVATELATNLIKHGRGGSILFVVDHVLTMVAIDKGGGMNNLAEALQDGYSTAGSPGTGLGAISRAADVFDVYSMPGSGTAVLCTIANQPSDLRKPFLTVGGVCTPKSGETVAGDGWLCRESRDFTTIIVADGLGHGPIASTAAAAATRVVAELVDHDLERLMREIHGALRPTRGAAVGLARVYPSLRRVDFLGVGNIAGGIITDGETRRVVSMPGIAGHEMRKVNTFSYPWTPSSVLLLHSDGVSGSWNANNYPGLMQHDPSLIAAVVYRDHCRGTDDATVVVAKAA